MAVSRRRKEEALGCSQVVPPKVFNRVLHKVLDADAKATVTCQTEQLDPWRVAS